MWPFRRRRKRKQQPKLIPKKYESKNPDNVNLHYLSQWSGEHLDEPIKEKSDLVVSKESPSTSYEISSTYSDSSSNSSSYSDSGFSSSSSFDSSSSFSSSD